MQFVAAEWECEGYQEQVWRKAWVDDSRLGVTQQTWSLLSGVKESLTKTQIKWPACNGPGDVHLSVSLFTGLPTVTHQLETHTHLWLWPLLDQNLTASVDAGLRFMLKLELNEVSQTIWIHLKLHRKAPRRLFKPTTESKQIHFSTDVRINRPMNMYTKAKLVSVLTFDLVVEICTYSKLINLRDGG